MTSAKQLGLTSIASVSLGVSAAYIVLTTITGDDSTGSYQVNCLLLAAVGALTAMVLLMLTLAFLAMRSVRWIVKRFKPSPPVEPTSQVSAWEEAGKRFKLPEDDEYSSDA